MSCIMVTKFMKGDFHEDRNRRHRSLLSVLQLKQGKSHFLSRARTRVPLNIYLAYN